MPKTILVTGGAGFIGSNLVDRLLTLDYRVICIDNFDNYYPVEFKEQNIREAQKNQNFILFRLDICEVAKVHEIINKYRVSTVFHLAARGGVRPSIGAPLEYEKINVARSIALLEACRSSGVKAIVIASSSSVYGAIAHPPFKESDPCDFPLSPYSASKRAVEIYAYTYHKIYGFNILITRFFNVYGPRNRPDMALYKFTENILADNPISINRGHKKDFTYISDVIDGLISAIGKKFGYEIVNLGRSQPITIRRYIRAIEKALNKKAKINIQDPPFEEMPKTMAHLGKARRLLSFRPRTNLDEGIDLFIKWYRKERFTQ